MAELKTKKNDASVNDFLQAITDKVKREDSLTVFKLMKQVAKEEPKMWGTAIIGVGAYQYKSAKSGRGGDWFIAGFSPRKQNITLYIMPGIGVYKDITQRLGKHKISGSCLHINKLADVDSKVLRELIVAAFKYIKSKNNQIEY